MRRAVVEDIPGIILQVVPYKLHQSPDRTVLGLVTFPGHEGGLQTDSQSELSS